MRRWLCGFLYGLAFGLSAARLSEIAAPLIGDEIRRQRVLAAAVPITHGRFHA